jgi:putative hydrolase of the HAD superfamily
MVRFRAAIFDFGGVLVSMVDDRPRLKLADELGVPLATLDALVYFSESAEKASRGEIRVGQHWQKVAKSLGIQPDEMPGFLQRYWSADSVNFKLLEFIRSLHPRYKVGLLSNAWDDLRQTLHNRWHIDGLFDELIISAEVGLLKPDPHIFHLALKRLGVEPEEAVFVDDMAVNVQAAQQEGITAIQFLDNSQTLTQLNHWLFPEEEAG